MIRRLGILLLVGPFLLVALALAQGPALREGEEGKTGEAGKLEEPPLRLKKRKRPDQPSQLEPKKEEPKKDEPKPADPEDEPAKKEKLKIKGKGKTAEDEPLIPEDGLPGGQEEDEKEILDRVSRTMRSVEEKLSNKELGDPTLQSQEDILKDLDSLIARSQQPPPSGGGGTENQPQGGQAGGEQGKSRAQAGSRGNSGMTRGGSQNRPSRQSRAERGRSRQRSGGATTTVRKGENPAPGEPMGTGTGKGGTTAGAGKDSPPGAKDRNADLYKDVWGHLPESLRAEMNAYSNPQPFLPRYDDLIKKYYRTIAEQGRRKGD